MKILRQLQDYWHDQISVLEETTDSFDFEHLFAELTQANAIVQHIWNNQRNFDALSFDSSGYLILGTSSISNNAYLIDQEYEDNEEYYEEEEEYYKIAKKFKEW